MPHTTSQPRPTPTTAPEPHTDASRGERLHKVLANAGVASRRQCELLITQGRVTINGKCVNTLPAWVDPAVDRVAVNGQPVHTPRSDPNAQKAYILLHKPRRVVSTSHDPQGRRCVTDLVSWPTRLFPVGRLDADSSGLILLTNDGELTNQLTHPRYEVPKQYRVSVRGHVTQQDLQALREGLYLAHLKHTPAPPSRNRPDRHAARPVKGRGPTVQTKLATMAQVKLIGYGRDRSRGDRTTLLVTLREGQNREIRRMLARLGHKVRRLERIAIGSITLKGLAVGAWRPLTAYEVRSLRHAAARPTTRRSKPRFTKRSPAAPPANTR